MNLSIPGGDPEKLKIVKPPKSRTQWYYNESIAKEVQEFLDKLHTTKQALRISRQGVNTNTLRLRYYQGVKYLLEFLDPKGVYKDLYSKTKCITFDDHIQLVLRTARATVVESLAPWKEELVTFLETAAPNDKFVRTDVTLEEDDITWINNLLAPLTKKDSQNNDVPLFYGQVERNKIILIRDQN